jgi:iron complex outermembrane receptor protein
MDYDLTAQNMLYGSVVRGYKPGGLNGKYGQAVVPNTFHPETNTAFEVGSKNSFLDHTLTANLAAFYYIYKNMQYIEYDPVPFDSGISNIPSIHEYGVEAEIAYQSHDHRLHIDASFALENGFAQGSYKTINSTIANNIEGTNANCAYGGQYYNPACFAAVEAAAESIKGKSPPDMPKFSGSVSASYRFDVPYGALTPRAQYVYRGSEWARIFNVAGVDRLDPYGVTNLNLEFVPTGSKFRMSIAATNVFNVDGVNSKYLDPYGTAQTSEQYIPPRQVIASVAYAF